LQISSPNKAKGWRRALCHWGYSFCETDISRSDEVQNLIAQTIHEYGRLDVAINNAAHYPDNTPLLEFDEKIWRRLMDVTLTGNLPMAGCHLVRI
jgi:NAD(P)-dependent dehydrogenase (short-subunit alcohol dehydrogenase family)